MRIWCCYFSSLNHVRAHIFTGKTGIEIPQPTLFRFSVFVVVVVVVGIVIVAIIYWWWSNNLFRMIFACAHTDDAGDERKNINHLLFTHSQSTTTLSSYSYSEKRKTNVIGAKQHTLSDIHDSRLFLFFFVSSVSSSFLSSFQSRLKVSIFTWFISHDSNQSNLHTRITNNFRFSSRLTITIIWICLNEFFNIFFPLINENLNNCLSIDGRKFTKKKIRNFSSCATAASYKIATK